jgi:hypothetical protein
MMVVVVLTSPNKQRDDNRGAEMTRAGPAVKHTEGSSSLEQCRGRTIYNATTTSLGPFGEVLDAKLPNGEVDVTLMELARIIKEEHLRVAKWQMFVYGQGPAHPNNIGTPEFSSTMLDPDKTVWVPGEGMDINEAVLEIALHQYFNVDEYMT